MGKSEGGCQRKGICSTQLQAFTVGKAKWEICAYGQACGVGKTVEIILPLFLPRILPPPPSLYSLEQLGQVFSFQGRGGWWQLVENFHQHLQGRRANEPLGNVFSIPGHDRRGLPCRCSWCGIVPKPRSLRERQTEEDG